MNPLIQLKTTTLPLLIAQTLICFGLLPTARAVLPPPDGGYPGANTAEGTDALFSLISGGLGNTAVGFNALFSDTTGSNNTATGDGALDSNTTGNGNTATGAFALSGNTTGDGNTAQGFTALQDNTTGDFNTANGDNALFANTTGRSNTASGASALARNTTGDFNTANGATALFSNTTGFNNTASGNDTLSSNTTGLDNTAMGFQALFSNTTGDSNTAVGVRALYSNIGGVLFAGGGNTAIGLNALEDNTTGAFNTANGAAALSSNTTGNANIALGLQAGENLTTGDGNIDIGNRGVAGEGGTIRIGTQGIQTKTFMAGINGAAVMGGAVKVNAAGQLGTAPSSQRFKTEIKPMDTASEAIHALKPVTFLYKQEIDPEGIPQFGLVAEEVEKVNPDLVARDEKGEIYTVRYEAVNAMLLNEFLKEHRTVQELKKEVAGLTATVKEQASQIQKVSAKLEVSKPLPQFVENN
jgi:hypothetical protein